MRLIQCDCCQKISQDESEIPPPGWATGAIEIQLSDQEGETLSETTPRVCICPECVEWKIQPFDDKHTDRTPDEIVGDALVTVLRKGLAALVVA